MRQKDGAGRRRAWGVLAVAMWSAVLPAHGFLRAVPTVADDAAVAAHVATPAEEAGDAGFHDAANPDAVRLQLPAQALEGLPKDQDGKVDWVKALRSGAIAPRERIDGDRRGAPLDLDVVMKNTKGMPWVRFPHRTHTEWLECSNCHPALFEPRAGSSRIRMEEIFRGRFCGTCHDRVAFVTHRNCFRCHSVPQDAAGK